MSTIEYLNPSDVIAARATDAPLNRSATGYGNKIPTSYLLRLKDKRWRRVYVIQWSNAGSAYVLVGGKTLFLGTFDPRDMVPHGCAATRAECQKEGDAPNETPCSCACHYAVNK